MEKPKVGDKLYSLNIGNAARNSEQKLTPFIVKKVGRKYFTAGPEGERDWMDNQYYLDDWRQKSDYTASSRLYKTKQAWEDEKEISNICQKLKYCFEYGNNRNNLSLSDLKKIESIVNKSNGGR